MHHIYFNDLLLGNVSDEQHPNYTPLDLVDFLFPNPLELLSRPESTSLRQISIGVENLDECVELLENKEVKVEPFRVDEPATSR